jgi:hypothetical protein
MNTLISVITDKDFSYGFIYGVDKTWEEKESAKSVLYINTISGENAEEADKLLLPILVQVVKGPITADFVRKETIKESILASDQSSGFLPIVLIICEGFGKEVPGHCGITCNLWAHKCLVRVNF